MMRLRANFVYGTLNVPLADDDTELVHTALEQLPDVADGDVLAISIDPHGTAEIVHITAHVTGEDTATILRGQEGTTAAAHEDGVPWEHAPTRTDYQALASYVTPNALGVLDPDAYAAAVTGIATMFGLSTEQADQLVAAVGPILGAQPEPESAEQALVNTAFLIAVLLIQLQILPASLQTQLSGLLNQYDLPIHAFGSMPGSWSAHSQRTDDGPTVQNDRWEAQDPNGIMVPFVGIAPLVPIAHVFDGLTAMLTGTVMSRGIDVDPTLPIVIAAEWARPSTPWDFPSDMCGAWRARWAYQDEEAPYAWHVVRTDEGIQGRINEAGELTIPGGWPAPPPDGATTVLLDFGVVVWIPADTSLKTAPVGWAQRSRFDRWATDFTLRPDSGAVLCAEGCNTIGVAGDGLVFPDGMAVAIQTTDWPVTLSELENDQPFHGPDGTLVNTYEVQPQSRIILLRLQGEWWVGDGKANLRGGNTFTGDQRILGDLPVYDATAITGEEPLGVPFEIAALDEQAVLSYIGTDVDVPDFGRIRFSGFVFPQWDPTLNGGLGGPNGKASVLTMAITGQTDDDDQPSVRLTIRDTSTPGLIGLMTTTPGTISVGDPRADADAVPRSWALTQRAELEDLIDGVSDAVSTVQGDVDDLAGEVDTLTGDVDDLAGEVGTLTTRVEAAEAHWQPVIPVLPTDSQFANDILAGDGIWHIDPTISSHQLYINSDAVFPGSLIPVQVDNPGPGKFVKLALIINNQSEGSPSLGVDGATTGAPSGQVPAHSARPFATPFGLDVFGGDPGFTVLWAYRVA